MRGPADDEFRGLRFIGADEWPGCTPCGVKAGDNVLRWCGQRLGAGANSGFQALNLAAVAGARRIVLTGYDMQHTDRRKHWHPDHGPGMSNPELRMLSGCARILDQVAPEFERRGIEVVNATRQTALRAYRRMSIRDALNG